MAASKMSFEVRVYKKSRRFNIPKRRCNELGINNGDSLRLIVKTLSGERLFDGRQKLKSGTEIYGRDISSALTPGSKISVVASEPKCLEAEAEAESFYVQERNAGFQPTPEIRTVVEKYAMDRAKEKLSELGFSNFNNTSRTKCYDYTCKRDGSLYYVEVKGTQGNGTSVIVTENEVAHCRKYQKRSIFVIVYQVGVGSLRASGGRARVCLPWIVERAALEPTQYKWAVSRCPDLPEA